MVQAAALELFLVTRPMTVRMELLPNSSSFLHNYLLTSTHCILATIGNGSCTGDKVKGPDITSTYAPYYGFSCANLKGRLSYCKPAIHLTNSQLNTHICFAIHSRNGG